MLHLLLLSQLEGLPTSAKGAELIPLCAPFSQSVRHLSDLSHQVLGFSRWHLVLDHHGVDADSADLQNSSQALHLDNLRQAWLQVEVCLLVALFGFRQALDEAQDLGVHGVTVLDRCEGFVVWWGVEEEEGLSLQWEQDGDLVSNESWLVKSDAVDRLWASPWLLLALLAIIFYWSAVRNQPGCRRAWSHTLWASVMLRWQLAEELESNWNLDGWREVWEWLLIDFGLFVGKGIVFIDLGLLVGEWIVFINDDWHREWLIDFGALDQVATLTVNNNKVVELEIEFQRSCARHRWRLDGGLVHCLV